MLKILIGASLAYLIVGALIYRLGFGKKDASGMAITMLFWPVILLITLFTKCCGRKDAPAIDGPQGSQGPQGPQGFQGRIS